MRRLKRKFELHEPGFNAAFSAALRLREHGFAAGLVGGSVRDLLLGKVPSDFDLVTSAKPEELAQLFADFRAVGASFGVSLIGVGGVSLEVATAREERNYLDGRHPELVRYTADLECDVQRRDFTINALWYDPAEGEVCDCVGGIDDLERGVVRTVGDAGRRFSEDYLRMLRAVRFAARLRFELFPETRRAIQALAPKAAGLAGERINAEVTRMLTGPDPARAVRMLFDTGLLAAVLPEVAALDGVEQPPEFHPEGDVLTHTLLMLSHMACADANLAWSVLLHDISKPEARTVGEDGRARFYAHESMGAELAGKILDRLRFSSADRDSITQAVRNHMRFASVRDMRAAKLRKLIADPNFPLELELHRLDCISCHGLMECFVFLLDRLAAEPEHRRLPEPWVRGRDLVAAGVKPGPRFKTVLEEVFELQLAGELSTPEEALETALERFR